MSLDNWIDLTSILMQSIIAVATIWLGWRVYKWTQVIEKTGQINSALSSINHLNEMALMSDENLLAIDGLYDDGRDKSIQSARKRWAAFLALQTHHQYHLADKLGLMGGDLAYKQDSQVLDLLLNNSEVVSLLENRGYDSDFVKHCKERIATKKANNRK